MFVFDGTEEDALYSRRTLVDDRNRYYTDVRELTGSKTIRLGLGYDTETIKLIKDSGLEVVLRPGNNNPNWVGEKYIHAISFNEYEKYNITP